MSYTPGPWEASDGEFYAIIRQEGVENGIEIAHVGKKEDAELIAAAPYMKEEIIRLKKDNAELLETLEEFAVVKKMGTGVEE